jgi:hypothetical protein
VENDTIHEGLNRPLVTLHVYFPVMGKSFLGLVLPDHGSVAQNELHEDFL